MNYELEYYQSLQNTVWEGGGWNMKINPIRKHNNLLSYLVMTLSLFLYIKEIENVH